MKLINICYLFFIFNYLSIYLYYYHPQAASSHAILCFSSSVITFSGREIPQYHLRRSDRRTYTSGKAFLKYVPIKLLLWKPISLLAISDTVLTEMLPYLSSLNLLLSLKIKDQNFTNYVKS